MAQTPERGKRQVKRRGGSGYQSGLDAGCTQSAFGELGSKLFHVEFAGHFPAEDRQQREREDVGRV